MNVIEVEGLTKRYLGFKGWVTAVDGLSFAIPKGGVNGFLGPNGSGKTTTMRCLVGLVRPSSGRATILGAGSKSELSKALRRAGTIIEAPSFLGRFSGRRNLRHLAAIHGLGKKEVEAVLSRVGLAERGDDLVKHYSLGMKQRLGVAAALLPDPELLVLDEPANGLDPAGMLEMRNLLRALSEEGRTIFLSSHLLSEVQHLCDRVTIISKGRFIAQGSIDEIIGTKRAIRIRVRHNRKALGILKGAGFAAETADGVIRITSEVPAESITRLLAENSIYLSELRREESSLEDIFLAVTSEPEVSP